MARFFDEARWSSTVSDPDWYVRLFPELHALREGWEAQPNEPMMTEARNEVRDFFDKALRTGRVALAATGQDLDVQRQRIDTVVVHHTSAPSGYPLSRMNSDQMLRIYVPYFTNPTMREEEELRGQPLWSNHVRNGRPVFYLYHWLIRMDGTAE